MEKQTLQIIKNSVKIDLLRKSFKKIDSTAFVLNFMPGQELPLHKHQGSDVFIMTIEDKGLFIIDGKEGAATKNDFIHCSDQDIFHLRI